MIHYRTCGAALACAAVLAGIWLGPQAQAQSSSAGSASRFSTSEYYDPPNEKQMKYLLKGAEGRQLKGGKVLITEAELQMFRTNGDTEIIVEAPECVSDSAKRLASSPGRLQVKTGDGQFSVEGDGFLWRQTNSSLSISNHVHSIIRQDLLKTTPPGSRTNAPVADTAGTEILSGRFDYDTESQLAIYRRNVRVTGTNLALTAGILTVNLPTNGQPVERITAGHEVIFDHEGTNATGEQMIYDATRGLLHFSGRPATWHAGQRGGHGDELIIDQTNNVFRVDGRAYLKAAGAGADALGFLSPKSSEPANSPALTNRFVEIRSDNYELWTNRAVFGGHVKTRDLAGDQLRGQMTCGRMEVTFSSTNEMERVVAEDQVVIEQEARRFACGRAVYTGADHVLELTDCPVWQDGSREGRGDVISAKIVNSNDDEMTVRGNAWMKLPANQIIEPSATAADASSPAVTPVSGETFAEITSDEYMIKSADAVFRGHVHVVHPQMELGCETMTARLIAGERETRSIVADGSVVVELVDRKGQKAHGTGSRMIYTCVAAGTTTNETIQLTGAPVVVQETAQGTLTLTGEPVTLDVISGVIRAHNWHFDPKPASVTNVPPKPADKPGKSRSTRRKLI